MCWVIQRPALSPLGYAVSRVSDQESCLHSLDRWLVFLRELNALCPTCRTTVILLRGCFSWRAHNLCSLCPFPFQVPFFPTPLFSLLQYNSVLYIIMCDCRQVWVNIKIKKNLKCLAESAKAPAHQILSLKGPSRYVPELEKSCRHGKELVSSFLNQYQSV